jgi:hypothetical protein
VLVLNGSDMRSGNRTSRSPKELLIVLFSRKGTTVQDNYTFHSSFGFCQFYLGARKNVSVGQGEMLDKAAKFCAAVLKTGNADC